MIDPFKLFQQSTSMNMQKDKTILQEADLRCFFEPRSIAVIGASANLAKLGGRPIAALQKKGFTGAIYPVNPRYGEIAGLPCYPSIQAVPGSVDLAVVSVPFEGILEALGECANKGVKAAVVFTAGFAEVGPDGQALQQEIGRLARESGMRILGPNCLGLVYFRNAVMASFSDIMEMEVGVPGSLGFVTQSGAYGEKTFMQAALDGVGFNSFVSVGNEADLQFSDFISYLLHDEGTSLLGVYLEGAKDGALFRRAAEAALRAGKPLLVKKVGRSKAGMRAAASHTGSLAGNDRIYDAFFRQTGIIRIDELRDLTSFAMVHQSGRMPQGKHVGILTDSGGPGVEMADKCEEFGLVVPELKGSTRAQLEACLPFYGSARNPVDMTAAAMTDHSLYGKCLRALFADENIDMIFAPGFFMAYVPQTLLDDVLEIYRSSAKPLVMCPVWEDKSPQSREMIARVKREGIPIIPEASDAARAMASLAGYGDKRRQSAAAGWEAARPPATCREAAEQILGKPGPLTEYEAKRVLAAYGIPVTREDMATTREEAVALARRIGYPVVLKIQSPQIPHKTEVDGIRLNLRTDQEVQAAYDEIMDNAKNHLPQAPIAGVLVQEMVAGGVEAIVGVTRDPTFGPCMMFGLGGIFVEVLKDVSFRVVPIARPDVEDMIREVRGFRLLEGVRGRAPSDLKALAEVVLKVSWLAADFAGEIEEIDINPLIVLPHGVLVADALIVKSAPVTATA
jgi:acetate---CoA ligase (ADP-forming)